jgi:hypothetical protein
MIKSIIRKLSPLILVILTASSLYAQSTFQLLNTIEGDSSIFGTSAATGDFNEDGFDDLAYLLDKSTINNSVVRTQVYLTYSTNKAPASEFQTAYTSDEGNELSDSGDNFGSVIRTGDLDGDGHPDLIIGSPDTGVEGGADNIGCVRIYYGNGEQPLYRNKTVLCGTEASEHFGQNLAVGDLDDDGRDDLAVYSATSVTEDQVVLTKGKVSVFFGKKTGIKNSADVVLTAPEQAYAFGRSLLIYKLHVDQVPVLIVGAPRDTTVSMNGGKVFIYPGLRGQHTLSNVPEYSISGDPYQCLGTSLAAGELYGSQGPELVVGTGGDYGCGGDTQVLVFTGMGLSVSTTPTYILDGSNPMVGQFQATGYNDLAFIKATKINIYFGQSAGLSSVPEVTLKQENITGFTLGDLSGDKKDDIVASYLEGYGNIRIYGYDECPDDPDKQAAGSCGCGNPDTDTDKNDIADCLPTAEMKYYVGKAYKKLKRITSSSSAKQKKQIKRDLRAMLRLVKGEVIQVKDGVEIDIANSIKTAIRNTKKVLITTTSRFTKKKKLALRKLKNIKNSLGTDAT